MRRLICEVVATNLGSRYDASANCTTSATLLRPSRITCVPAATQLRLTYERYAWGDSPANFWPGYIYIAVFYATNHNLSACRTTNISTYNNNNNYYNSINISTYNYNNNSSNISTYNTMELNRDMVFLVGGYLLLDELFVRTQRAIARYGHLARQREEEEARRGRKKRIWVRDWILKRPILGWHNTLMVELEHEDPKAYRGMIRMDPSMFREIEERLHDRLQKYDTNYRAALTPSLKLSVALKFYASGADYRTLSEGFRVLAYHP